MIYASKWDENLLEVLERMKSCMLQMIQHKQKMCVSQSFVHGQKEGGDWRGIGENTVTNSMRLSWIQSSIQIWKEPDSTGFFCFVLFFNLFSGHKVTKW